MRTSLCLFNHLVRQEKNVIFDLMKLIDSGLGCSQVEHRLEPFSLGRA